MYIISMKTNNTIKGDQMNTTMLNQTEELISEFDLMIAEMTLLTENINIMVSAMEEEAMSSYENGLLTF